MRVPAPLNVDAVTLSRPSADTSLLDVDALRAAIAAGKAPVGCLKQALEQAGEKLDRRFRDNDDIEDLVRGRAWVVDQILSCAWQLQDWPAVELSLVAVGGYGRGELAPHSDIDILLLTKKNPDKNLKAAVGGFLTLLWDAGLEIGQSVRSVKQCVQEASADITVATALMESRTLTGPSSLQEEMYRATTAKRVWPIKKFMRAKWDEQLARHEKYHDIDYALQPNIKTSPGGLRDIQTIAWVAKRHFNASSFRDLQELGFLTEVERALIDKGQRFLWRLRYGLHLLEGRREDRLLFDKQRELAKIFGYEDDELSLGVEKLMQRYYRTVGTVRGLNDLLLQHFDEVILRSDERDQIDRSIAAFRFTTTASKWLIRKCSSERPSLSLKPSCCVHRILKSQVLEPRLFALSATIATASMTSSGLISAA
jgi:[protein-PII] uridylyltransferase